MGFFYFNIFRIVLHTFFFRLVGSEWRFCVDSAASRSKKGCVPKLCIFYVSMHYCNGVIFDGANVHDTWLSGCMDWSSHNFLKSTNGHTIMIRSAALTASAKSAVSTPIISPILANFPRPARENDMSLFPCRIWQTIRHFSCAKDDCFHSSSRKYL